MHKKGKQYVLTQRDMVLLTGTLMAAAVVVKTLTDPDKEVTKGGTIRIVTLMNRSLELIKPVIDADLAPLFVDLRDSVDKEIEDAEVESGGQAPGAEQASGPEDRYPGGTWQWKTPLRGANKVSWSSVDKAELENCPPIGMTALCPECSQYHPVEPHHVGPERLHIVRCPTKEGPAGWVLVGINGKDITALRRRADESES